MTMDRDELAAHGQLLFGPNWIGPFAEATGVSRRSVARMAAGRMDVPADLAEPLRRAALMIGDFRAAIDRHAPVARFTLEETDDHPVTRRTGALLERSLRRILDREPPT